VGATFQVKNVPILYSPYLSFPVKSQRQSGFLFPRIGFSDTAGAQVNLAYFWAIARNMDATFYLDLATRKGIGEGVEYRYIRKNESYGGLNGYHIREGEEYRQKYTDKLDRKPDRWQANFNHDEYFDPSFFSKTRLRAFSDRQYFVDYGATYADQSAEQCILSNPSPELGAVQLLAKPAIPSICGRKTRPPCSTTPLRILWEFSSGSFPPLFSISKPAMDISSGNRGLPETGWISIPTFPSP
jgi:hypothetical protein